MYKFVVFCTLMVCALSAPTDKETPSASNLLHEKSLLEQHQVDSSVLISSPSTEKREDKREKREDFQISSSSSDNKRTPQLSQPDYQENKPPTFVHPVPVDQIIKNSHASPQIHSTHRKEVEETANSKSEEVDEEGEESKPIDDDNSKEHHRYTHKKITSKTNIDSHDDEDSEKQ